MTFGHYIAILALAKRKQGPLYPLCCEPLMIKFKLNGAEVALEIPGDVPLLWALREECGAKSVKFGCGQALCGACTVHVDGKSARACVWPVADVEGKEVTTLEGINPADAPAETLHIIQQAWLELNVPQCGYCQTGQIMSALAMLKHKPDPTDEDIDAVMSANLCRCGTYPRIRQAIKRAAALMAQAQTP